MKTFFPLIFNLFSEQNHTFLSKSGSSHKERLNEKVNCSAEFLSIVKENTIDPKKPLKSVNIFNEILNNQSLIEKINRQRPKIFIYTDFGGGKNSGRSLVDLQTSGEIASAGWKATLQQIVHINDSAAPLSIIQASRHLEKTFPYIDSNKLEAIPQAIPIQTIVVHVVDPGVGNQENKEHAHPRSIVLRKDGVLFIGPDNGTLTWACPVHSIAGIWEINNQALGNLSGIDYKAGGTFHGRDLFCEAAFRIAAGVVSLEEIGVAYPHPEIKNKLESCKKDDNTVYPVHFETVKTDRCILNATACQGNEQFEKAFLLGVIQSLLYQRAAISDLTNSKKIFVIEDLFLKEFISIVNKRTGNIFVGPNNGLGTSFFKNYESKDWEVFSVSRDVVEEIKNENNNEKSYGLIKQQPVFNGFVNEINFFGDESSLTRDALGRPQKIQSRIWVDLYGNIKTTLQSTILNEVKNKGGSISVILNDIQKSISFADTFSQVPEGELFIYNGSSGVIGQNPARSNRYVEITANGVYGKFGVDYFSIDRSKPHSGQSIYFHFEYNE
jgi:S-adenosylmethionine hydrolase